jgi:hypothetical protein
MGHDMTPQRIQLRRTKGWRKPESAIVVARPGRWGNPFHLVRDGSAFGLQLYRVVAFPDGLDLQRFVGGQQTHTEAATIAVHLYREWISTQSRSENLVPLLCGHDLACWCPLDQPCHADVLLELANGGTS